MLAAAGDGQISSLIPGAGPKLTGLAMSYCGHLSASPLQQPSAPSDIYTTAVGVETIRVNVPVRIGKGTVAVATWTYTVRV